MDEKQTNHGKKTNTGGTTRQMTEEEIYNLTEEERDEIKSALWHYLLDKYRRITDLDAVINQRTEVTSGIYEYPCPCQTVYLDENAYAVTYGRQTVGTRYINDDELVAYTTDTNPTPPEEEYTKVIRSVFYDFREETPTVPENYTGDVGYIPTKLGPYEWKRSNSGGGGVIG